LLLDERRSDPPSPHAQYATLRGVGPLKNSQW
jgi:hypothetical protein